ncbi:MAG: hypothetical protein AB8B67_04100 [Rickettsiaceae bacterium]
MKQNLDLYSSSAPDVKTFLEAYKELHEIYEAPNLTKELEEKVLKLQQIHLDSTSDTNSVHQTFRRLNTWYDVKKQDKNFGKEGVSGELNKLLKDSDLTKFFDKAKEMNQEFGVGNSNIIKQKEFSQTTSNMIKLFRFSDKSSNEEDSKKLNNLFSKYTKQLSIKLQQNMNSGASQTKTKLMSNFVQWAKSAGNNNEQEFIKKIEQGIKKTLQESKKKRAEENEKHAEENERSLMRKEDQMSNAERRKEQEEVTRIEEEKKLNKLKEEIAKEAQEKSEKDKNKEKIHRQPFGELFNYKLEHKHKVVLAKMLEKSQVNINNYLNDTSEQGKEFLKYMQEERPQRGIFTKIKDWFIDKFASKGTIDACKDMHNDVMQRINNANTYEEQSKNTRGAAKDEPQSHALVLPRAVSQHHPPHHKGGTRSH